MAIVRVSGPDAGAALETLSGERQGPSRAQPRLRRLRDAADGEIDQALVLWFEAPASFTGEDSGRISYPRGPRHCGGYACAHCPAIPRLRPAEPGEFTRRAVENGKLDLTRAEALADLIDAETEAQRRQALRQYDGALYELYEDWRARLIAGAPHGRKPPSTSPTRKSPRTSLAGPEH